MNHGFIIDTHLLRELGDLLVGRDSTAVLELVKNGYDADAETVRIDAQKLNDPSSATLIVEDDGNGMTLDRFRSAFLRIAGRDKETGARVSPRYGRAYTGQKGIGRLASQKLARELEVSSQPYVDLASPGDQAVRASIDWEEIDRQDRLDQLTSGLQVEGVSINESLPSGTILTLKSLKREWSRSEIATFINELRSAQPPTHLTGSNSEALRLAGPSLFGKPRIRGASENDPGFTIQLTGDLASGDDLWTTAAEDFSWCVEIDVNNGRIHYRVTPTKSYTRQEPIARAYSFHAETNLSIRFQARFFVRPNASSTRGPLKGFVRANSGIRVYLEGFRVLPYGEYNDDWLGIDRDYRAGSRYYTIDLDEDASDLIDVDRREALNATASNSYYGAVFLTNSGSPDLESLINREGFVPGPTFEKIRSIVQDGVRLSVRVRRSIFNQKEALSSRVGGTVEDSIEKNSAGKPSTGSGPQQVPADFPEAKRREPFDLLAERRPSWLGREAMDKAAETAVELTKVVASDANESQIEVRDLLDGFQAAREALQTIQAVQPELRTLAGVGLQLGAFVHDINGMLASATAIRELLQGVIAEVSDRRHRRELQAILRTAEELAHTLARQSSYLTDVLSTDPRRRRSRVSVFDKVQSVLRFIGSRITDKNITIHVEMMPAFKTPPMFPAEVMILLTNLLTNAVKNAAEGGNIWIRGREDSNGNSEITIANDGIAVDLDEAERWFLPFESTTTAVDEVLGQGLGLGLPIVRAIVDDYRGDVRFIEPIFGSSTSIQVFLRKKGSQND